MEKLCALLFLWLCPSANFEWDICEGVVVIFEVLVVVAEVPLRVACSFIPLRPNKLYWSVPIVFVLFFVAPVLLVILSVSVLIASIFPLVESVSVRILLLFPGIKVAVTPPSPGALSSFGASDVSPNICCLLSSLSLPLLQKTLENFRFPFCWSRRRPWNKEDD